MLPLLCFTRLDFRTLVCTFKMPSTKYCVQSAVSATPRLLGTALTCASGCWLNSQAFSQPTKNFYDKPGSDFLSWGREDNRG